jgi:hypothetical protein
VAKRTPDYTKQVRHEKPGRQPVPPTRKKAAHKADVPPPAQGATALTFVSLIGGVALYAWAVTLAMGSSDARVVAISVTVAFCGLLTNILTGVLAVYALNPGRHPMPRVDKRMLAVIIIVLGVVVVFFGSTNLILAPGMIPPVVVFFFVIRPRLKVIAQVAGTYRPTKRDEALAEIQERRAERQREKEREAQLKRTIKRRQERGQAGGPAGGRTDGTGRARSDRDS